VPIAQSRQQTIGQSSHSMSGLSLPHSGQMGIIDQEAFTVDFTRATELTPEVEKAIEDAFEYHPWNEAQQAAGKVVRAVLADAVKMIVKYVPPSPDRSAAIRKIREARMDANSGITHGGKY
jgi:hypothetical protein